MVSDKKKRQVPDTPAEALARIFSIAEKKTPAAVPREA